MIHEFRLKLDEMLKERGTQKKAALNIIQNNHDYKTDIARVDADLELLGISTKNLKNGYRILAEEQEREAADAKAWVESDVIEGVVGAFRKNQKISNAQMNKLAAILDNADMQCVHTGAAMALVAACESGIVLEKNNVSFKQYEDLLEKACSVLIKEQDSDLYYAQWGHIIYEYLFRNLVRAGKAEQALEVCREAYGKFAKIKHKSIKSARNFQDAANTEEELRLEVKLVEFQEQGLRGNAKEIFEFLLNEGCDTPRNLLKKYRYEILKDGIQLLLSEGIPLAVYQEEIVRNKSSFMGDLRILFEEYEQKYAEKKKQRFVDNYIKQMRERVAGIQSVPEYAQAYIQDVGVYQDMLKNVCCSMQNIEEIKLMSAEAGEETVVPEVTIAQYLDHAKGIVEAQIREKLKQMDEARIREEALEDARRYVQEREYREALAEAYLVIAEDKYESDLAEYLKSQIVKKNRYKNEAERKQILEELTNAYVEAHKESFERWREGVVKDMLVQSYETQLLARINEIDETPEFAEGYVTISGYKERMRQCAATNEYCGNIMDLYHREDVGDIGSGVVPEAVVSQYFARIAEKVNDKIKADVRRIIAEKERKEAGEREKANKEACVSSYKQKISHKLQKTKKLSFLGTDEKLFDSIDDYRSRMEKKAYDFSYISEIERSVAKNKWDGSVPDAEVEKYFQQALQEVLKDVRTQKAEEVKKARATCENAYRESIAKLINEVDKLPSYAKAECKSVQEYRQRLEKYCKTSEVVSAIGDAAVKNGWKTSIPDGEVQKQWKEAVANVKRDVKVPAGKKIKNTVTHVTGGIAAGVTNTTKAVAGGISKVAKGTVKAGKVAVKVGVVVLVIGAGVYFIGRPIHNSFKNYMDEQNAKKLEYAQSDEGLEKNGAEEIKKNIAKLSSTATAASEFTYELKNNEYVIIKKYNGTAESVEIPAVIDGKNVCEISNDAFKDNIYLKKLVMPDTILYVQAGAFMNCKVLQEITFSDNLTYIGRDAFNSCEALTAVTIGSDKLSVKTIDSGAFAHCKSLESASISTDVFNQLVMNEGVFSTCPMLKTVTISGKNVDNVYLGKNMFMDCAGLSTVELNCEGDFIVVLGEGTFRNCTSLTGVSFANKITEMGAGAFAECKNLATFAFDKLAYVPYEGFMNCTALTEVHFTKSVGDVNNSAFSGCTALSGVTFETVELAADNEGYVIGDAAFYQTAISEVEIPGQYREVCAHSFANCPNLVKFVWHNSGKNTLNQTIVFNAFYESYALKEIYLPRTIGGTLENFRNTWTPDKMGDFTVYATEGSTVHTYVTERGIKWSAWTE